MVYPDAIQDSALQPVDDESMCLFEDVIPFHTQRHQRIHIEKPAVAKLLTGRLPVRQPIVLLAQKVIQLIFIAVQLID